MPIKIITIEMPDGTHKRVTIQLPDEPKTADQQIREKRAPGFDDQTPVQAALAGFREGAVEGAKGFAKEIAPGVVKAAVGIPGAIFDTIRMAVNAGGEGAGLFTDPVGTLTRWRDAAGELSGKAKQALDDTIALAANDPQKFGAAVADLTAETGVGFATAKAIPTAGKPLARKTGPAMASLGEKSRFPLRISGGAAIASGNLPVGAGLMATPEVLETAGKALTKWGNTGQVPTRLVKPGGAVVASKTAPAQMTVASEVAPTKAALPRFVADTEKALTGNLDDLVDPARAGLESVDEVIDAEKKRAGTIRIASGKREAAARRAEDAADLSKINADEAAAAGAESTIASELDDALSGNPARERLDDLDSAINAERKAGDVRRRESGRRETATRKAEEAADLSQTRQTEAAKKAAERKQNQGLTPLEQELLKRATSVTPVGAGSVRITLPAPRPVASALEEIGDEIDLTSVSGGAPNVARERAAERFGRNFIDEGTTIPAGVPKASYLGMQEALDEGSEAFPLFNVEAPGHPLHGSTVARETLEREGIAVPDIPTTKSKNPLSAIDSRLTENDVDTLRQIVAENPGVSTEELQRLLLDERAMRSRVYRSNAGLDKEQP